MQQGLCLYNVATEELKQITHLTSFLFKFLKHSQVMMEHLNHEKTKVEKNFIGHKFTMVDQKCQVLQAQKAFDSNESKLEGMTHEISTIEKKMNL
jgi:hypothetical protein